MKRLLFALLAWCGMCSAGYAAAPPKLDLKKVAGAKPINIVFILSDDHRYDVMSSLGHPWIETPAMDALARDGVYCENAKH